MQRNKKGNKDATTQGMERKKFNLQRKIENEEKNGEIAGKNHSNITTSMKNENYGIAMKSFPSKRKKGLLRKRGNSGNHYDDLDDEMKTEGNDSVVFLE